MKKILDTEHVYFEIVDGILYATYKDGVVIDLPTAHRIVESRLGFTGDQDMLVVVIIEGVATIDKTARYFISSPEGVKGLTAAAIIIDSPVAAVIGNFFASVNRPEKIPVKLFTHKNKAVVWLLKKQGEIAKKNKPNGQAHPHH